MPLESSPRIGLSQIGVVGSVVRDASITVPHVTLVKVMIAFALTQLALRHPPAVED